MDNTELDRPSKRKHSSTKKHDKEKTKGHKHHREKSRKHHKKKSKKSTDQEGQVCPSVQMPSELAEVKGICNNVATHHGR